MTYRQAQELGVHVRKGEKSTLIVVADKGTKSETDEKGEEPDKNRFPIDEIRTANERNEQAEQFFANTGATVLLGRSRRWAFSRRCRAYFLRP